MNRRPSTRSKRKSKASTRKRPIPPEPITISEMASYISREVRSLMVQAKNTSRRLEKLFWFAAHVSVACNKVVWRREVSPKRPLADVAHDAEDSQP